MSCERSQAKMSCVLAMRQVPASQRKSRPLKRARPGSGTASGSGSDGEDAEEDEESPLVIGPRRVTASACCIHNACTHVNEDQWTRGTELLSVLTGRQLLQWTLSA